MAINQNKHRNINVQTTFQIEMSNLSSQPLLE